MYFDICQELCHAIRNSSRIRWPLLRGRFSIAYDLNDITSSYRNKLWISRKNDKAVIIMITTQILLLKTIEGNRRLRVKVRVRFLLFYLELAPTDPWCNMLQILLGRKKYEEAMSGEHYHRVAALKNFTKLTWKHLPVDVFLINFEA